LRVIDHFIIEGYDDLRPVWQPCIDKLQALKVAARSALPPLQTQETKEDARVAPFNPRVAPTGSTAEESPGNATAAERTEAVARELRAAIDLEQHVKVEP
jgi:hypothetical protein